MSVIDEIKNKAKANKKTVVLPETTDMRTLTAAAEVISEEIADIILVGKEDEIKAKAEAEGLDLAKASFVDPENCDHLNTYIESLCEARKSKGLLPEDAKEILLSNPLFFGATMVRVGDADGMVAGAINSSANVLRAALQVVKTAPGTEIVSAFMLMDTQAKDMGENGCFVCADCGLNQNPNPEQLTDLMTIRSLKGRLGNITNGLCGDLKFGRTVHSLINALIRYENVKFILISPEELKIPDYIREDVLQANHVEFEEVERLEDAMSQLDVLYMTRVQKERFFNEEDYIRLKDFYILTKEKMELAKDDMIVLHPLPRVNEISVEVDDDPRAAYFTQVQNGVYVRMALILTLLGIEVE